MPRCSKGLVLSFLLCLSLTTRSEIISDPLNSVAWETMYNAFFPGESVVIDDLVKVYAPDSAENPMVVPVLVDASELEDVTKIIVIADLNPIPRILEYYPTRSSPKIGFRFKIEQRSPVRALVRTADGIWHMNGIWIDAAGGGCTAPSLASGSLSWADRLGQIEGRVWPQQSKTSRLKFRINHPMDTGLADGIPAYYIEQLTLVDEEGIELGRLSPFEPVSEDPVFSLDINTSGSVGLWGRDNNGNIFKALLSSE